MNASCRPFRLPRLWAGRPRRWLVGACALWLASVCQAEQSASAPESAAPPGAQAHVWLAASNHTLARLRGGFDLGGGLKVSFGISRAVFVNGQSAVRQSFQVGDISALTLAQAQALGQQLQVSAPVVQNGPGNSVDAAVAALPLALYLQNTLNQQSLRSETVIDASTSGLSMVKGLNLQATLDAALNSAIGKR